MVIIAYIKDPKATLESEFKCELPKNLQLKAVEETAETKWFLLPYIPQHQEFSDTELQAIAGGGELGDLFRRAGNLLNKTGSPTAGSAFGFLGDVGDVATGIIEAIGKDKKQ